MLGVTALAIAHGVTAFGMTLSLAVGNTLGKGLGTFFGIVQGTTSGIVLGGAELGVTLLGTALKTTLGISFGIPFGPALGGGRLVGHAVGTAGGKFNTWILLVTTPLPKFWDLWVFLWVILMLEHRERTFRVRGVYPGTTCAIKQN